MSRYKKDYLKYFQEKFPFNSNLFQKGKVLIVILGCFGDFDSLEYAQSLFRYLEKLKKNNINLFILGIGNYKSKKIFSNYTGIPESNLEYSENNEIHKELNLKNPILFNLPPIFNMLLMCAGINSNGTLREVLRGYSGDCNASRLITSDSYTLNIKSFRIKPTFFDKILNINKLRPFELATIRLNNMLEIISNWNLYFTNINFISQRGATFLYDDSNRLVYSFFSQSLLLYSETMNKPLEYIENNTDINL